MSRALPPGKIDPDLLVECLALCPTSGPDVLVGPGPGEDAAAVISHENTIIVKSDPVTFATDRIGWYAVHVAANDVATRGADPRWLLLTVLLPHLGATEEVTRTVFRQVGDACRELGVVLVGGHTEVTGAVGRPVVSASMLAPAPGGRVLCTRDARPGDVLVMTRHCPIEGSAILARELREVLAARGVAEETLDRAASFLDDPGISVVAAAHAVRGVPGVHALHDPTEGGVLCGLWEVALAAGLSVDVDVGAIPISPEGAAICHALVLDPLRTIASGSLLISCAQESADDAIQRLAAAGIPSAVIGTVLSSGRPTVFAGDPANTLPFVVRDELTRAFGEVSAEGA